MEQYLIFILINNDRKRSNSDFDLEVIVDISGIIKNDREDGVFAFKSIKFKIGLWLRWLLAEYT